MFEQSFSNFNYRTRFAGLGGVDRNAYLASDSLVAHMTQRLMKKLSRAQMRMLDEWLKFYNGDIVMIISFKKQLLIFGNSEVINAEDYMTLL
jgi:hypothetical protein